MPAYTPPTRPRNLYKTPRVYNWWTTTHKDCRAEILEKLCKETGGIAKWVGRGEAYGQSIPCWYYEIYFPLEKFTLKWIFPKKYLYQDREQADYDFGIRFWKLIKKIVKHKVDGKIDLGLLRLNKEGFYWQ